MWGKNLYSNMTRNYITINKEQISIVNSAMNNGWKATSLPHVFGRIALALTKLQKVIQQHSTLQLLFLSCKNRNNKCITGRSDA